jgi:thioesterase-3
MNENIIFVYDTLIQEHHLDSFGHVNNASYIMIYEQARWDLITKNGLGLEYILQTQTGPVILDLSVRFKRELKNRELIKITSQVLDVPSPKIIILEQTIINQEEKISSNARFTMGFFDLRSRKLMEAPCEWLKAIGIKT